MRRIEPASFRGARAYFTNFDPRILAHTKNRDKLRREVERRLKILLLTKNFIVCAGSHLTSDFTYHLFRENPILLNQGLVIPALRRDKTAIGELFEKRPLPAILKKEMVSFYDGQIQSTVNWDLEVNSGWFRDSFLRELRDDRSVLRKNLVNLTDGQLERISKEIEKDPLLERAKIDILATDLDGQSRRALVNFRELIYHISGARVVNCESALPQENYVDYSLADIEHRQIVLSESQIFWKIFLELIFETVIGAMIRLDAIDILSFEDIFSIRKPIERSSFRDDYEAIIKKSIESLKKHDFDAVLYDVEELMTIRERLAREFEATIEKELRPFIRKKVRGDLKGLGRSALSIGLGVASYISPLTAAAGIAGTVLEGHELWINLNQSLRSMRSLADYRSYVQNKQRLLKQMIEKSEISKKTTLLGFADLLTDAIGRKLTL